MDEWKDGEILFYRTLSATARGPTHTTPADWHLKLKLVSATFYQIFIFSPNDSPLKPMKSFLFQM